MVKIDPKMDIVAAREAASSLAQSKGSDDTASADTEDEDDATEVLECPHCGFKGTEDEFKPEDGSVDESGSDE